MKKEDVVWHEEDEYEVMKDPDGWTLIVEVNHFKGWMHYDIKTPDNHYLGIFEEDIYKAIDILNEEKRKRKNMKSKYDVKPGDKIHINWMEGEPQYAGREGIVRSIDDIGSLHGSWGGLALLPEDDWVIIEEK